MLLPSPRRGAKGSESAVGMILVRLAAAYRVRFPAVLILALSALTLLAWHRRFIQDDAFISFRYAYNLAHGKGLVWNEGERVEGYTNFLYTLIMSLPLRLEFEPVVFSFLFGLVTFVACLVLTYRVALRLLGSRDAALAAVILLGTNYTFSSFATGGLETELQAGLFVGSIYVLIRAIDRGTPTGAQLLTLSLLLSMALLTRLDSVLMVVVVLPVALGRGLQGRAAWRGRLVTALCLLGPLAVLVGGWLVWKVHYYGDLLPNAYYVKAASYVSLARGAGYVYLFLQSYWLLPFPLLLVWFARELVKAANRELLVPLAVVVLWFLYTIRVGGDFIEFRFLVPVLPLCFILIAWIIFVQVRTVMFRIALVAIVLVGSLQHAYGFTNPPWQIENIGHLAGHLAEEGEGWVEIGQALGQAFDHDPSVTIALTAVGAIPFHSRLRTIDMLGVNDRRIASEGLSAGSRPGHQRLATFDLLVERGANLVLAHPITAGPAAGFPLSRTSVLRFLPMLSDQDRLPGGCRILEIPVNAGRKLFAVYLVRHPRIDAVIEQRGWRSHACDRSGPVDPMQPEQVPIYKAGARIDFTTPEADGYLWYGWSGRDLGMRWTTASKAAIVFALDKPGPSTLRIKMGRFLFPPGLTAQRLDVELNGHRVTTLTLADPESTEISIALPGHLVRSQNVLRLAAADAHASAPGIGMQVLRIGVQWMELQPATEGTAGPER